MDVDLPLGQLRKSRAELLDGVEPVKLWPQPEDPGPVKLDAHYRIRKLAVELYVAGVPEKDICAKLLKDHKYKLKQGEVWRLFKRCIAPNKKTGEIHGLWALLSRQRLVAPRQKRGELGRLFEEYPALEGRLCLFVLTRNAQPGKVGQITPGNVHACFTALCKELNLQKLGKWPYVGSDRNGYEAIRRWLQKCRYDFPSQAAVNELGDELGKLVSKDHRRLGQTKVGSAVRQAFARTELDEHHSDALFTLLVPCGPRGAETWVRTRPARLWALAIIETGSKAVLSTGVSNKARYDHRDVLRLVSRALQPPPRPKVPWLSDPEYRFDEGACYPGELPEFRGNSWQELAFDSDAAHVSMLTRQAIEQVTGCVVSAEGKGDPESRPFIEGYFRTLAGLATYLESATGNRSDSPVRRDPAQAALVRLIRAPVAEELFDMHARNYNVRPQRALGGLSPLQQLHLMAKRDEFYRAPLGELGLRNFYRLLPRYPGTIRHRRGQPLAPLVVCCMYAEYMSPELNNDIKELAYASDNGAWVYVEEDARYATVVPNAFPERAYKVVVRQQGWRNMPHTVEWRALTARFARKAEFHARATGAQLGIGVLRGLANASGESKLATEAVTGIATFIERHERGEAFPLVISADEADILLEQTAKWEIPGNAATHGGEEEDEEPPAYTLPPPVSTDASSRQPAPARKKRPFGL